MTDTNTAQSEHDAKVEAWRKEAVDTLAIVLRKGREEVELPLTVLSVLDKAEALMRRPADLTDYAISLQKAIERHCRGLIVDEINGGCPHHAKMLNKHHLDESRPAAVQVPDYAIRWAASVEHSPEGAHCGSDHEIADWINSLADTAPEPTCTPEQQAAPSDGETCTHGNPINGDCAGKCEHGITCGEACRYCAKEYAANLRELMRRAGEGDVEKGRSVVIDGLLAMCDEEAKPLDEDRIRESVEKARLAALTKQASADARASGDAKLRKLRGDVESWRDNNRDRPATDQVGEKRLKMLTRFEGRVQAFESVIHEIDRLLAEPAAEPAKDKCHQCDGSGRITIAAQQPPHGPPVYGCSHTTCSGCGGTGKAIDFGDFMEGMGRVKAPDPVQEAERVSTEGPDAEGGDATLQRFLDEYDPFTATTLQQAVAELVLRARALEGGGK